MKITTKEAIKRLKKFNKKHYRTAAEREAEAKIESELDFKSINERHTFAQIMKLYSS